LLPGLFTVKLMRLNNKQITAVLWGLSLLICVQNLAIAKVSRLGGDFSLTDQNEKIFELNQLQGNVVLVFFGYTSCPDVCPTELGEMAQILRAFEKQSDKVKGLFITVDPERDSAKVLKQYTSYFSKNLLGLTGSREQIDKVAKLYQANYRIYQNENRQIVVDHSSNLYVIDRNGDLNTIIPFGMSVDHVIDVVDFLLKN
jgi:protein SCO1